MSSAISVHSTEHGKRTPGYAGEIVLECPPVALKDANKVELNSLEVAICLGNQAPVRPVMLSFTVEKTDSQSGNRLGRRES